MAEPLYSAPRRVAATYKRIGENNRNGMIAPGEPELLTSHTNALLLLKPIIQDLIVFSFDQKKVFHDCFVYR